jgi:fimbrial isopeptide formation D2 family protein
MNDTTVNQARLWIFNRTTHTWSSPGLLPAITPYQPLVEGAMYADAEGYLYASVNLTGDIWRIDVESVTAALLSNGQPSTNNDGARCANAPLAIDFGDAPFLTMLANTGPRHELVGYSDTTHTAPLMLGKTVDNEPDGFASVDADGDDLNNIEDEDAITHIVAPQNTPTTLSIPVTVTNNSPTNATLAGWIDVNGNNTFETNERKVQTIPANTGTAQYEMEFPSTTFTGNAYSRFRIFEGIVADPQPTGGATAGEVEDHLVQVGSYTIQKTSTPTSGTVVLPGDTITYTLAVTNTGLTDLIDLALHDDLTDVLDDATMQGVPIVSPVTAGIATVDVNTLQFTFTEDILAGQSVEITYSVKVKPAGELGSRELQNMVIGANSNCHPNIVNGQVVRSDDPYCSTEHSVYVGGGLANTGQNMLLVLLFAGGLVSVSVLAGWYVMRRTEGG